MRTYYANFSANNGTYLQNPIEDTCLERIIKDVRAIAEGNRLAGNECSWSVWVEDESRMSGCRYLAAGGMYSNGQRYRTSLSDLIYM